MRRLAGLAAAGAMVLAACTPATRPTEQVVRPGVDLGSGRLELAASLQSFDDCGQVLDYFQESATAMGAGFAGGGTGGAEIALGGRTAVAESQAGAAVADSDGAAATTSAPQAGVDFSETNVQEAGVDEPDIVKTDGSLIVAVARNRLHVVDATGDAPVLRGSLALGNQNSYGGELFLVDDRVLLLTNGWREEQASSSSGASSASGSAVGDLDTGPAYFGGQAIAVLTAIDISDPDEPRVEHKIELDGEYVTARLAEGTARIVLRSTPQFQIQPLPEPGPEEQLERQVERQVQIAVARTELDDWLPSVRNADGESQPLVGCDAVSRPPEPSGVGTVTVVTVDATRELDIAHSTAVVANAETVYASQDNLYIATNGWLDPRVLEEQATDTTTEPAFLTTELHKFDITDPATTSYVASGRVRGHLLNQWSLSEHSGHLRAATTEFPQWFPGRAGQERQSESFVTVLDQDGDALTQIGQVGGLGHDERIYAVRYFGDTGYVVTFRQTDPLYVLDLSEPAAPRVTGELKIMGYSAYLHPVGDGLLLGVGQDATEEGMTLGTQLSLFDVSDPADPRRTHQVAIGSAHSAVEFDHRAFLWWAAENLTVLPVEVYDTAQLEESVEESEQSEQSDAVTASPQPSDYFAGVFGFTVDGEAGFAERGRLSHADRNPSEPHPPAVTRSLVIGDGLYTLSELGLLASDLETFDDRGWVGF